MSDSDTRELIVKLGYLVIIVGGVYTFLVSQTLTACPPCVCDGLQTDIRNQHAIINKRSNYSRWILPSRQSLPDMYSVGVRDYCCSVGCQVTHGRTLLWVACLSV